MHASDGETLSTALLQAMSMALPIVATDVPGIRNLLGVQPPCGFLVDGHEPLQYAVTVLNVVENWPTAIDIGLTGRELAVAHYGHREMFAKYNQVICDALY